MRCSVSSPDETPRRELEIRRAAEYFWRTSRFFIWWWNTASYAWYITSNFALEYNTVEPCFTDTRRQNSSYFKQKLWNGAENRERDWGETPKFFTLALTSQAQRACEARARKTLYATLYRFLYWFWEKNRLFCSLDVVPLQVLFQILVSSTPLVRSRHSL